MLFLLIPLPNPSYWKHHFIWSIKVTLTLIKYKNLIFYPVNRTSFEKVTNIWVIVIIKIIKDWRHSFQSLLIAILAVVHIVVIKWILDLINIIIAILLLLTGDTDLQMKEEVFVIQIIALIVTYNFWYNDIHRIVLRLLVGIWLSIRVLGHYHALWFLNSHI